MDQVANDWHDNPLQLLECATPICSYMSSFQSVTVGGKHCSRCCIVPSDYTHLATLMCSGLQLNVAMFAQAMQQFVEGVKQIYGLEVVGKPDMRLVDLQEVEYSQGLYSRLQFY